MHDRKVKRRKIKKKEMLQKCPTGGGIYCTTKSRFISTNKSELPMKINGFKSFGRDLLEQTVKQFACLFE